MKTTKKMIALFLAAGMLTAFAAAEGNDGAETEGRADAEEQAVEEIQPLIELSETVNPEGMSLEEVSEAVSNNAMSDYFDSATGFSMQYPAFFQFDEENGSGMAVSEDRKAELRIEHMVNNGALNEETLLEAIRMEAPDQEPVKNEQTGCLRSDHPVDGGKRISTDLYLLKEKYFHHITMIYPEEEKEKYAPYIEYMINSMTSEGADLG